MRQIPLLVALVACAGVASSQDLRLTEEMRIDGNAEVLTGFYRIVVAKDGRVFIPQGSDGQFRIYDSRGRRIGAFGRKGEGPGEFDYLDGVAGWQGDTLWIFDVNQRRVTYVGPDLRVVRTTNTLEAGAKAPPAPDGVKRFELTNMSAEHVYADGSYLTRFSYGPKDPATGNLTDWRYVIVNPRGDVVRDLAKLPPPAGRVFYQDPVSRGVFGEDVPFASHALQSVSPDGARIALVSPAQMTGARGAYTITVVRSTGEAALTRTYTFDGDRIPRAILDSALNDIPKHFRGRAATGPAPKAMFDAARAAAPEFYAPVTGLTIGADETIWLTMHAPASGPRVRALDGKGNAIGEVTLRRGASIARATRTQLWVIERDDDNVQSLVRYSVSQSRTP